MRSFQAAVWAIFLKDMRIEFRTREIVFTVFMFALLIILLLAFGLGLGSLRGTAAVSGVYWVAVAVSGILALSRTFERERENRVFDALLHASAFPSAVYLGKTAGIVALLLLLELALLPVVDIFFGARMLPHLLSLLPIMLLATLGYAALGVLLGAMTVRTRLRDLLLGVMLYPLLSPVLIAATKATSTILDGGGIGSAMDYIQLLVAADTVFVVGGLWLFGSLMED